MSIPKLVVEHRLKRSEIAAAHRRVALVLEGEDFLVACSSPDLPCGFTTRFELEPARLARLPSFDHLVVATSAVRVTNFMEIGRDCRINPL